MITCVVKGCTSKSSPKSSLTFYTFPSDPTRQQLWSRVEVGGPLRPGASVCSLHFSPADCAQSRLRPDAAPRQAVAKVEAVPHYPVCRICLEVDRNTYDLSGSLRQDYCDVTGVSVSPSDRLPRRLCWECAARVRAAARLRARALRAQDLLTQLLLSHGELTMNGIQSINRRQNKLTSKLTQHYTNYYYEFLNEDTKDAMIFENEVINKCFDDSHDNDSDEDFDVEKGIGLMYEDEVFQVNGSIETDPTTEVEDNKDRIALDDVSVMGANEVDGDEAEDKNAISEDIIKVIEVKDIIGDKNQDIGKKTVKTVRKKTVRNKTVKEKRPAVKKERRQVQPTAPKCLDDFTVTNLTLEEEIAEVQKRQESMAYQSARYKCDICYRGYLDRVMIETHMLKHSMKSGDHECVVCKFRFQTRKGLRSHMTRNHKAKFSCKKCPFSTKCRSVAADHLKYHKGAKYKCQHCPRVFHRSPSYYSHLRIKHACDFVCELCGYAFLSQFGVANHKRLVHKFDKETLAGPRCEDCDVTFASEDAHAKHLKTSSRHSLDPSVRNEYKRAVTAEDTPVTCDQCDATLASFRAYAGHFRRQHPGEPRARPLRRAREHMCEQCGRTFQSIAALTDHKHVHTGLRNFKCGVCDKAFVTRLMLYVHMRMHRDTPSFACPECGKTFAWQGNRNRHMLTHSDATPFECEACGKRTGSKEGMWQHIAHVHNKKPWPRRRRAPEH